MLRKLSKLGKHPPGPSCDYPATEAGYLSKLQKSPAKGKNFQNLARFFLLFFWGGGVKVFYLRGTDGVGHSARGVKRKCIIAVARRVGHIGGRGGGTVAG